jgi:hypothetical protein
MCPGAEISDTAVFSEKWQGIQEFATAVCGPLD